jgi:hypothetical protein
MVANAHELSVGKQAVFPCQSPEEGSKPIKWNIKGNKLENMYSKI